MSAATRSSRTDAWPTGPSRTSCLHARAGSRGWICSTRKSWSEADDDARNSFRWTGERSRSSPRYLLPVSLLFRRDKDTHSFHRDVVGLAIRADDGRAEPLGGRCRAVSESAHRLDSVRVTSCQTTSPVVTHNAGT